MPINILQNYNLSTFIAAIISLIGSIYIFKATPKYEMVLRRYETIIYPLFHTVEPYLFKPVNIEILDSLLKIIEENQSVAGGKLNEIYYFCRKNPSQENYNNLCRQINREYDYACKRLGLKQRSILYRVWLDQYQTKLMMILYLISQLLLFLFLLFVLFIIFGFLIYLVQSFNLSLIK